jgi:hypothetical protein
VFAQYVPTDPLKTAEKLFADGHAANAARLIWLEREKVLRSQDTWRAARIDKLVGELRAQIDGERLAEFDAIVVGEEKPEGSGVSFAGGPSAAVERSEQVELSRPGLALAGVGALLMLIAVFLPRVESTSFNAIVKNTLIQSGDGWIVIGIAAVAAGDIWRSYSRGKRPFAPVLLGLAGVGIVIYDGTNKAGLRLCPAVPSPLVPCSQATPGIGIYAAGIGAALVSLGGYQLWRSQPSAQTVVSTPPEPAPASAPPPETATATKTCPDCAETVLEAARVCRYCGYRFD